MAIDQHELDEDGEHWRDECELCIEREESVQSNCDCGNCCERLLVEASLRDAVREPRIASECRPMRDIDPELVVGYFLNDRRNGMACHFFDREARLCTIYETRPLVCRIFNCNDERRDGVNAAMLSEGAERPETR